MTLSHFFLLLNLCLHLPISLVHIIILLLTFLLTFTKNTNLLLNHATSSLASFILLAVTGSLAHTTKSSTFRTKPFIAPVMEASFLPDTFFSNATLLLKLARSLSLFIRITRGTSSLKTFLLINLGSRL